MTTGINLPNLLKSRYVIQSEAELEDLLLPENDLERDLLAHPDFRYGMMWGEPRFGHPEGKIALHVREIFDNIDRLEIDPVLRSRLRLVAMVHDTFKYRESRVFPRDWSKHHAVLARRFMETRLEDDGVLDVIELHDEAYYSWRHIFLFKQTEKGLRRLHQALERVAGDLQLFYLFFKCDTLTGDKNPAPLLWFEESVFGIQRLEFVQ